MTVCVLVDKTVNFVSVFKKSRNWDDFRQSGHFLNNFYFCEKLNAFRPAEAKLK